LSGLNPERKMQNPTNLSYPAMAHQLKKSSIKLVVIVIFLLSVSIQLSGQNNFRPGYYITWENDTIFGLIDYRGEVKNSGFCLFKKDETSEPKRFEPSEIQAYRFTDSKYYITRTIHLKGQEKQVFLEFLVDGITNLYFYHNINNYSYFVEDKNGKWIELTNEMKTEHRDGKGQVQKNTNRYIGQLKATFADCNEIQALVDRAQLGHKSLINLTKSYHDYVCNNEECIVYEKKLPSLKVRIAPVVRSGMSFLSFREGIHSRYTYDPEIYPSVGVLFNGNFPGMNEKISFEAELDMNKYGFHGSYEEQNGSIMEYYDSWIDIISLQPSLAVKYTFPTGKIKPTISAGVFTELFVSTDPKIVTVKMHPDTVYTFESHDTALAPYVSGGFVQLGCNFSMLNNHTAFANLRLCHSAKRDHGIRTQIQSVNVNVGMYLTKEK
jgi:hypothetical protein